MSLTPEWKARVEAWMKELRSHFYRPIGEFELEGFFTKDHLLVEQAQKGRFKPTPAGTRWGEKWEYGWFRGTVTVPSEAAGQWIVARPELEHELLYTVNGKVIGGGRRRDDRPLLLSRKAKAGERFELLVEAYAGHGPAPVHALPTPPGRHTVPEPEVPQATVGQSTFGIWDEDAFQLWIDVNTLWEIRQNLDENSLRLAEIDAGLRDFTTIADFEVEVEQRLASFRAARKRLAPLLACRNGSTAPQMYAFGHAHIDVAWLWPLAQTERKAAATLGNALTLAEMYPGYRFLQSEPHLYWMVKTYYPELWKRVKKAVKDGSVLAEGGMWVEADTNISGGESLIRQFIHGRRFFREEFGVENEILWLPDVFGYSGAMPQIMRGCGIKYFATAKIFWAYYGGDPYQYNTFDWEGIDGSRVLVHLCNDYNSHTRPSHVIQRWTERVQKDGIRSRLLPFGWGDGGGGPTREHLEYVRREEDLEGVPKVKFASPNEFFHDLEAEQTERPRYVGELYFQAHRGTYTSQARTKRGNRKSEIALREAEMWVSFAAAMKGAKVPHDALESAWRNVLLNQFHDIIPGTSIHRVYEQAEAAYEQTIAAAAGLVRTAAETLTQGRQGLTVFNSLSWSRTALVPLPKGASGAVDAGGGALPVQQVDGQALVEVTVPACGWTCIRPQDVAGAAGAGAVKATKKSLENEHLRVVLNDRGEITSLFDKDAGRELAAGPCNQMRMFRDNPAQWDAWDIDSPYVQTPVPLKEKATVEVAWSGPLAAKLRVERKLNDSSMVQEIVLRAGSRRVDFVTTIDWQERHKLLKVAFPVDVSTHEAIHEIQFGHLRRPNHASRQFDADRFEVANHKWSALAEENRGVAVLNDCKYGLNVVGNTIQLTLLRSPMAPDETADRGRQEFTYSVYAWNGTLLDSDVVREAYDLNVPVTVVGGSAGTTSMLSVDAENVVVEAVKPAEDRSGDVIVRLYEAKRSSTSCTLTTALPVSAAQEIDMVEETVRAELSVRDGTVALTFRPFEVKTVRLKR